MKIPEPQKTPGGYKIRLRLNGVYIPVVASSAKECRRQAALIKAEYLAGRRVVKSPNDRTLRSLLTGYLEKSAPALSPSTIPGYRSMIEHRFSKYMDMPLGDIDYQRMVNTEIGAVSPKTLKNAWGLVTAAMRAEKIPVPDVKLPDVQSAERPYLTPNEIQVFLKEIAGHSMEIPALMALLGLRRSELAAVTWDKVDLKAGLIRVEGAVVKNADGQFVYKETNKKKKSRRTVPIMIPQLLDALKAVPESERTGRVVKCHPNSVYKAVNAVCARAGLPLVGVHGLRHSFASLGHAEGVPEHEMQLIGGWEDAGTMRKIYTHISDDQILRAQNAMAGFYQKVNGKNLAK